MAQNPLTMEQLKQILQLKADGVSIREIARRVGVSRNSVRKYLSVLKNVEPHSDAELAKASYQSDQIELDQERVKQLTLHFNSAGTELKRTGVTRQLLHQEYLTLHPDGYSYSRYCYHLSQHFKNRDLSMHLEYDPADMIMIDFAGKKLSYTDIETGEVIYCDVFVAILPFSGLIFCIAVHSQASKDFIICINAMLKFFGGVTATIVCDNMRTAVKRASRYEPQFTDLIIQLSEHYATTFSATRPYSPRDKAMVEGAVRIVYTNIYAPLRNQTFTSLNELNAALLEPLSILNGKAYKKTPYSRTYYFEQKERSFLKALPSSSFCPKNVVILTVQRNYHVQLTEDHRYYSVPYLFAGRKVKVLYDSRTVEVYFDYERIAVHVRSTSHKAYSTLAEHMPPHHHRMHEIKGFNKEDLLAQAALIGTNTQSAVALMLENSIFIEQNYKACFGMLMLKKKYGAVRLEAACQRALIGPRINYTMIKNILERGLDRQLQIEPHVPIPAHNNIRGKDHYQ